MKKETKIEGLFPETVKLGWDPEDSTFCRTPYSHGTGQRRGLVRGTRDLPRLLRGKQSLSFSRDVHLAVGIMLTNLNRITQEPQINGNF